MKTPKVKKREVSMHSRAARRGEAPPSKDLAVKAPVEETDYKPWLHSAQNAGILKKKHAKALTHAQRQRQQKALEKAELNAEKLEKKVGDSKKRARKVQARRADWEELNGKMEEKKPDRKMAKSESGATPMEDVDLEQPASIEGPHDHQEADEPSVDKHAIVQPQADELDEVI